MEKKLYIIRHCEAEGQPLEAVLTEKGRGQAEALAEFFGEIKVDRIISSPFVRAVQSIKPLALRKNLDIELDERLCERILSGRPLQDWLEKLQAAFDDLDLTLEGGESSRTAMKRIVRVAEEVLRHGTKNTLIVTHGNLMSLLLHHYDESFGFEVWRSLTNPDVFVLQFENGQPLIDRVWGQ
jgi:2,3-bisphosphoglycerate-dependent phosphoglycerate mutase